MNFRLGVLEALRQVVQLPQQLLAFATAHRGLISANAAKAAGIDTRRWSSFVSSCHLVPVHTNVARIYDSEESPLQRIQAAVLSCGDGALASHRSAAKIWGCDVADKQLDVTVERRTWVVRHGVTLHRPSNRSDLSASIREGIPCTNPLRMLADLGLVAPQLVIPAMDHVILAGLCTRSAIEQVYTRLQRPGRVANAALGLALQEWPLADQRPDSQLEIDFARLLVRNGLDHFKFHAAISGYEVDFAFPIERIVIETDGWESHQSREAFERDRRRDSAIVDAGWTVVRLTWMRLHTEPAAVVGQLQRILRARQ